MNCSIKEGWTALNGGLGWCSCLTFVFSVRFCPFSLASGHMPLQSSWVHLLWWPLGCQFIPFSWVGLLSSSSSLFTKWLQRHLLHLWPGTRSHVIYRLFKFYSFRWGLTMPFSSTCISSIKWCFSAQSGSVRFSIQSRACFQPPLTHTKVRHSLFYYVLLIVDYEHHILCRSRACFQPPLTHTKVRHSLYSWL